MRIEARVPVCDKWQFRKTALICFWLSFLIYDVKIKSNLPSCWEDYVCVCVCVCVWSRFSCVWLFETLWTVAHQAPLSMGFSRQGDLPHPGTEPASLMAPALAADSLPQAPSGKPQDYMRKCQTNSVKCLLDLSCHRERQLRILCTFRNKFIYRLGRLKEFSFLCCLLISHFLSKT